MVLHDLNLASRFSDRLLLLHNGRIVAAGTPKTVLTPENIRGVYGVEAVVTETRWGLQVTPVAPLDMTGTKGMAKVVLAARG